MNGEMSQKLPVNKFKRLKDISINVKVIVIMKKVIQDIFLKVILSSRKMVFAIINSFYLKE